MALRLRYSAHYILSGTMSTLRIAEENWTLPASLFPAGWQQMAWQSGAVERLRGVHSGDFGAAKTYVASSQSSQEL
jgi:hypothetical protein